MEQESKNNDNHLYNERQNNLDEQNNGGENITNLDEVSILIKEIPLNNLNDYYDIETNLFKKRIEKLNLKFYWIYDSVLGEENTNNLLYPYNKLFLILFKEISLYIEEILRLNKQLNLKNKNEKYYIQKLNDYKLKEKDFLISKQVIKNLQRNIKSLEKNNEKLKNEIDKMNKKIFSSNMPGLNHNTNFGMWKHNISSGGKHKNYNKAMSKFNTGITSEQGSVMSSGSNSNTNRLHLNKKNIFKELGGNGNANTNTNIINSNSSINSKTTNISLGNNYKDIVCFGITQCEDEINNLNMIENMLTKYYDNNNKKKKLFKGKNKSCKKLSTDRIKNNQFNCTLYKRNTYYEKRLKKSNKSIECKTASVITNTNKI